MFLKGTSKDNKMNTVVHIINHTHWDREWFLTSVYTSQWIPGLIEQIESLVANNPNFQYLLDGQTLIIEDLQKIAPEYETRVKKLIAAGHLIIGPYYCQPDWQITGGETLIRNLLHGSEDMQRYGCQNLTGWLVDTFGHTSQTPQIHQLFGINSVFVWRGVPRLEPYFQWQGANGQSLFSIDLFGGYRNLYGVTHVPEVAAKRLQAEADKLQPFYPTPDIPLFDGYDLEQMPEDPKRFYESQQDSFPELELLEASPAEFAQTVSPKLNELPLIYGELNSGKYGATFPGTFSARTYLKVMDRDCEYLLHKLAEPLAVMAHLKGRSYNTEQYETWDRMLLQNTVHDCICGVSIDQVHEKMEYSYRQVFEAAQQDIHTSLSHIFADFAPGTYAVSTIPGPYQGWQLVEGQLHQLQTDGVGVWPLSVGEAVEDSPVPAETFEWQNSHYHATVNGDGTIQLDKARLGYLVVSDEQGDTYSDEAGEQRDICTPTGPLLIIRQHQHHTVVQYDCILRRDGIKVSATVQLIFDQSPLIRWQIDLDSRGTDFRVDLLFETGCAGQIQAGMPFDVVERPVVDTDLLPRQLDDALGSILLGQREIGQVRTFPFQEFVATTDGTTTAAVLARGLHSYQADDQGTIAVTLRRSVEQLTRPNLNDRVGDAGPFFYVPDARCERTVKHELAVMISDVAVDDVAFHQINAGFQNPPLVVQVQGDGQQSQWQLLQEGLPLSSLRLHQNKILARFFNPTTGNYALSQPYPQTDIHGNANKSSDVVAAKGIVTLLLDKEQTTVIAPPSQTAVLAGPTWRVGDNMGVPDPALIEQLKQQMAELEKRLQETDEQLSQATGNRRHILQHQYYIVKREYYEARLSIALNEEKLARKSDLNYAALYESNDEIAKLGLELNRMRTKRRIYDYVVEAIADR
jgi:alpha-mannosidase